MLTPQQILEQIHSAIGYLVDVGLSSDQNSPFIRRVAADAVEVTFQGAEHVSASMRDRAYREVYEILSLERAFSARLPDGALIQLMYLFRRNRIERHRLAFFPSPNLEEFQNSPDVYLEDVNYADVVARSIVPFPLRFDFDRRDSIFRAVDHPRSHLTLGQYEHCRIPVTAPLTPYWFVSFVLRNFYHTAFRQYVNRLPVFSDVFTETIDPDERNVVYVHIPVGAG